MHHRIFAPRWRHILSFLYYLVPPLWIGLDIHFRHFSALSDRADGVHQSEQTLFHLKSLWKSWIELCVPGLSLGLSSYLGDFFGPLSDIFVVHF